MLRWRLWSGHCRAMHILLRPASAGLSMGPIRALTWFAKHAGRPQLPDCPPVSRLKGVSLPLPLLFVSWLEHQVASDVLFYGTILTCVWGSLHRWWTRAMPCAFLLSGITGSASASWATHHMTCPRQAVADMLAPSRAAFWQACLLLPRGRHNAPSCLGLCHVTLLFRACLASSTPSGNPMSHQRCFRLPIFMAVTLANALCWFGDANCTYKALRRIQSHHHVCRTLRPG